MSIQAVSWCLELEDAGLKPPTRLVLVAVCNYADEDGECFPSQKKLGKNTGMTARTVRSHLQALECLGYVSRDHRQREDGSRASDLIRIHMDKSKGKVLPVGHNKSKGKDSTIQRERFDNPKGKNEQAKGKLLSPLNEPSLEPSPEPSLEPSLTRTIKWCGFDILWIDWAPFDMPNGNKKMALLSWKKNVEGVGVDPDMVVSQAAAYCAQCRRTGSKTQHVATWLNQAGWDGDFGPPMTGGEMAMQALTEKYRREELENERQQNRDNGIGHQAAPIGLLTKTQSR